mgnify:CR=1 FL=1
MPMVFFLDTDGTTRIGMDSTSSVSISMPSTASTSSTMSGKPVSDEVIEGNVTISVSGIVTYSKLPSQVNNLDPLSFQKSLQVARRNKRRLTVYLKDSGQPLMQNYKNCVLTNVEVTIDKFSDAITVNLGFEQIFVSQAATISFLAPKVRESAKPTVKGPTSAGQSTATEATEKERRTMFEAADQDLPKLFKSVFGG